MPSSVEVSFALEVPREAFEDEELSNLVEMDPVLILEFLLQVLILERLKNDIVVSAEILPVVDKGFRVDKEDIMTD